MAEYDVVDVVLASVTFFEIFSSDNDTEDNANERRALDWMHDVTVNSKPVTPSPTLFSTICHASSFLGTFLHDFDVVQ